MKFEPIPEVKHAILGGSSAGRWTTCLASGWLAIHKGVRPRPTTEYSAWGTAAHVVAEKQLVQGKKNPDGLPEGYEVDGFEIPVSEEMLTAAWEFSEPCLKLASMSGDNWAVEQCVDLNWLWDGDAPTELFGYVDFWCVTKKGVLYIVDLKAGMGVPVTAEKNEQLYYYALGVMGQLKERGIEIKKVKLTIIQPRMDDKPDVYECDPQEITDWAKNVMIPAVNTICGSADGLEYKSGGHCTFCPVPPACGHLVGLLQEKVATLPGTEFLELDDVEIGQLLDDADTLGVLFSALKREAMSRLEQMRYVPGWEIGEKLSNRRWFDGGRAGGDVERLLYALVEDEAFKPRELLSPAQAEKVLRAKGYKVKDFEPLLEHTRRDVTGYSLRKEKAETTSEE